METGLNRTAGEPAGVVDRVLTLARRPGAFERNGALSELLGGKSDSVNPDLAQCEERGHAQRSQLGLLIMVYFSAISFKTFRFGNLIAEQAHQNLQISSVK